MEKENKEEGNKDFTFPLAPLPQTLFPGCFLLIQVFETKFKNVIKHMLTLPFGQRLFCLFQNPNIEVIDKDVVTIGCLVKLCNVYAQEMTQSGTKARYSVPDDLLKQPKFLILVKCVSRVKLIDCYSIYEDADDKTEEELEFEQELYEEVQVSLYEDLTPNHMSSDDTHTTTNLQLLQNAIEHSHSFAKRFTANSIWQNILLRIGQPPLPLDTPYSSIPSHLSSLSSAQLLDLASQYSFWLASASLLFGIAGSTKVNVDKEQEELKHNILKTTSPFERLAIGLECFKRCPPVKHKLQDLSEAAISYDVHQSELDSMDESEDEYRHSRVRHLKDLIVINICKYLSEIFEATNEDERSIIKSKYSVFLSSFEDPNMQLPGEIYEKILIFLHRQERLSLALLQYFNQHHLSQNIEVLFLSSAKKLDDAWLNEIQSFSNLRLLDVSGSYTITNEGVDQLLSKIGPQLRSLYINRCKKLSVKSALNQFTKALSGTTKNQLETLSVAGVATEEQFWFSVESQQGLSSLTDLNVSGTKFTDSMLTTLRNHKMVVIDLGSTQLKNPSGEIIAGWSNTLQSLSVAFLPGITDWEFLKHLKKLKHLDVRLNSSFDEQVTTWWNLHDLESLNLSKTEVTDQAVMKILQSMNNLRVLDVSKSNVGDLGLEQYLNRQGEEEEGEKEEGKERIGRRARGGLQELYVQYTEVGMGVAKGVKKCGGLKVFKVTGSPGFGDREMKEMLGGEAGRFRESLEALDVGVEGMTDEGVKGLGVFKSLKNVGIWSSKVTPQGALAVKNETGLQFDDKMRTTKGTYIFRL